MRRQIGGRITAGAPPACEGDGGARDGATDLLGGHVTDLLVERGERVRDLPHLEWTCVSAIWPITAR